MERVGPYGFNNGHFFGPEVAMATDDMAAEETEAAADFDSAGSTQAAPSAAGDGLARSESAAVEGEDFSGTNNQEEGVDEADLVKTDGRRLLVVSGNRLEVIDVTGSTPELVDTIRLPEEFYGGELFLSGDTVGEETTTFLRRCGVPHLSKPVLIDQLQEKARQVLESPGGRAGRGQGELFESGAGEA